VLKTTTRFLMMALGLAMFLSLPSWAAEPAMEEATSMPVPTIEAGAPAPATVTLADIFGKAPAPQQKTGTKDCDLCSGGINSPGSQCGRYCASQRLCVDQCYADADTCALVTCICLSC
jgi:hypothetical protein